MDFSLTEDQKVFAGTWQGTGSNVIYITEKGSGDCEVNGVSVENGSVTITENTLVIGLFGIGKEFSIDEHPYQAGDGSWTMVLSGEVYQKIE